MNSEKNFYCEKRNKCKLYRILAIGMRRQQELLLNVEYSLCIKQILLYKSKDKSFIV